MLARRFITVMAFLLWGALAFLTIYVLFDDGPDFLVLISLVVVAVMGFGIFGALGNRR